MSENTAVKTIVFEDHGQDFQEWDIDAGGTVVAVRPQRDGWLSVWLARRVENPDLHAGDTVRVHVPELVKYGVDPVSEIKLPVAEVR